MSAVSSAWVTDHARTVAHGGFSSRLAVRLAGAGAPPVAIRIDATLLSVDLSGFTRLGERLAAHGRLGPEVVQDLMNRLFDGLVGIALEHGGDVLKFRGDALLILFEERHPSAALAAATAMQRWLGDNGRVETDAGVVRLRMTAGIASGRVDLDLVGDRQWDLMVTGPAVGLVVARESEGRPGQVVVGDDVAAEHLGTRTEHGALLRLASVPHAALAVSTAPVEIPERLVAPWLRDLLAAGEPPAEHRLATIAFVQVGGIAALHRRGRARLSARLAELASAIEHATSEFGITWVESDVAVDGVTVVLAAGMPKVSEQDEERLVRASRAIVREVPRTRAGLHRGPVFVGPVGPRARRTYAVSGETMNVAARLMGRAADGEVLATAAVVHQLDGRFSITDLPPMQVKGKRVPVRAARIGGPRRAGAPARAPSNTIGRTTELAILVSHLDGVTRGEGAAISVEGDAGIGKSTMIHTLVRVGKERSVPTFCAAADPYAQSTPYAAIRDALRERLGIAADANPDVAGAALTAIVQRVAPDLVDLLPLLAIPVGASVEPTSTVDRLDERFVQARLHDTVEAMLVALSDGPLLLVLEDFHWVDDASRELVAHLAAVTRRHPWLVVVTGREATKLPGESMTLASLRSSDARALALDAAGDTPLDDRTLAAIGDRAAGNPLFVRELVAAVLESGRLDATDTVEQVMASRIDGLAVADRTLLREAAVMGARVDPALLATVLERPEVATPECWQPLRAFVEQSDTGYRFAHDLLRVVAYEGLPHRRRRELHRRTAQALIASGADEPARVAWHFADGRRWREAWVWGRRAADRAIGLHAVGDAAELLERSLDAARHWGRASHRTVGAVARQLGEIDERLGRFEAAQEALADARRARPEDPVFLANCFRWHGNVAEKMGRYPAALRWYRRGLRVIEQETSPPPAARRARAGLELGYGVVRFFQGRYLDSTEWVQRALESIAGLAEPRLRAQAHLQLEMACSELRSTDREGHGEKAVGLFTQLGDDLGLGNVLLNVGFSLSFEGRWDESFSYYGRSHDAFERCGDVIGMAYTLNNGAEILTDQGRNHEARDLLREARRVWRAADYRIGVAITTSGLARLDLRDGDVRQAGVGVQQALDEFKALGSESYVADTLVRILEWSVVGGTETEVQSAADRARSALTQLGHVQLLPITLRRLEGAACARFGDPETALTVLDEAEAMARSYPAAYEIGALLDLKQRIAPDERSAHWIAERDTIAARLGIVRWPPLLAGP